MPHHRDPRSASGLLARSAPLVLGAALAMLLSGCGASGGDAPATAAAPAAAAAIHRAAAPAPLSLGDAQRIPVASSFGPATGDVPATVTVLAVRDHVAPRLSTRSIGTHWASAQVKICRTKPVVLGYPAWVLGDESGRTAQASRVPHAQFPQPVFDNASRATGCEQGWVTFVTADDLVPTRVSFEQTSDVRAPWLIAGSG